MKSDKAMLLSKSKEKVTMRVILSVVLFVAFVGVLGCQTQETTEVARVEMLWPKRIPGQKNVFEGDTPTLTYYLPSEEKDATAAVIICPGGGYRNLAIYHEGHQVAQWLNSIGVAGFILRYRHHGDGYVHPTPLRDAQRAIRTVRARAAEYNVDPDKVGIMGFSAGGHLASTAGTLFSENSYEKQDEIDEASSRPDFMVLVYASVSLKKKQESGGSLSHILGNDPDPALVEKLSTVTQVTKETPPTFLIQSGADPTVPAEQSVMFYQALLKAGVPAEFHLYQTGRHGFGLGTKRDGPVSTWPNVCANWMRQMGFCE